MCRRTKENGGCTGPVLLPPAWAAPSQTVPELKEQVRLLRAACTDALEYINTNPNCRYDKATIRNFLIVALK